MGRWGRGRYDSYWPPYVSVAEKRRKAKAQLEKLQRKGAALEPVVLEGNRLARTFWGKAWCDNLLRYSDFANRMPRGRSYVRNGHVLDLRIAAGTVTAKVAGTRVYDIEIGIKPVDRARWRAICGECAGGIESLVSLLQGKLSAAVMEVITRPGGGLFPEPKEIALSCSCPDWAVMCKHVAAALYGVGARLDERPELLFALRGVDHLELIGEAAAAPVPAAAATERVLLGADLGGIFGIEVDAAEPAATVRTAAAGGSRRGSPARRPAAARAVGKRPAARRKAGRRGRGAVETKESAAAAAVVRRYELLLARFSGRAALGIRRLAVREGLVAAITEMRRLLGRRR